MDNVILVPAQFLSTLSLRRATLLMWYQCNTVVKISIHALLAESDLYTSARMSGDMISIHALLAESDAPYKNNGGPGGQFLSTLSLRRATVVAVLHIIARTYFYPRSPCGERPT